MNRKRADSINKLYVAVNEVSKTKKRTRGGQASKIKEAHKSFFAFCNLRAPDFYRPDRKYLVELCDGLQAFYESNDEVMIINMPPRHGKSRTAGLFAQWVFGKKPREKIMTGSYNEKLSTSFSKAVRNGIQEEKAEHDKLVYSDIFPGVRIQRGDAAANLWALEGQYASYLATSPTGTATGFGCSLMMIDDIIKNALDANNSAQLTAHWDWYTNTMLSRLEEGGKIIIIMTRWASGDLAGSAIQYYTEQQKKLRVITMKALQDDGSMLCEDILSRKTYEDKIRAMGEDIASANYQQIPIDLKGKLYSSFKTYEKIPMDNRDNPLFTEVLAYCDTADEGSDYLCNIIWGIYNHEAYVLDVYYTKAPMEITEKETAQRFMKLKVTRARIESNNGGRGFARAVKRILEEVLKSFFTLVRWFHQSKNKQARILTNAPWVMEHIYYPVNWRDRWPEYYKSMNEYQREGKNAHDDAQDATTGVAETMTMMGV